MVRNFQGTIRVWITTKCLYLGFLISVTSGHAIFWPAPILCPTYAYGSISLSSITFEPGVIDEWNLHQYACLINPIRMTYNMTHFDLTSDLGSNFELDFLRSNWVSFDFPRRYKHNGGKIVALDLIAKKLLKKILCAKNWCLTSVNFDLWSLNEWPEVKSETTI